MQSKDLDALSNRIIGSAITVHKTVGPGLLESTYKACLLYELRKQGMQAEAELPCPVIYDGQLMTEVGYRMDILVERQIVLEIKGVSAVTEQHMAQLLTYLRHSRHRLGLLLNFHEVKLGIHRRVNGL